MPEVGLRGEVAAAMKLRAFFFSGVFVLGCSSARNMSTDDGGSSSDAGSSVVDTGVNACTYPQQNIGTSPGNTVRSSFTWDGYAAGSTQETMIASKDLFDCDGSKGINAIIFDVSAEWCPACESEAADMHSLADKYDALGIKVITLMIQDASHNPAMLDTVDRWMKMYDLKGFDVAADPGFSFQPYGSGSLNLPYNVIVDPRTMTIVKTKQGYIAAYPLSPDADAVAVAKRNGAQ